MSAFCFHAARLPRILTHPQQLKDAVPGETLAFTIQASGTEPLNYQWEFRDGRGGWQSCDVERFPGANSPILTIPSVQKSNKGSYRCVISNIVDTQISEPVQLSIGKIQIQQALYEVSRHCISIHAAEPPRITAHPQETKDAIPGNLSTSHNCQPPPLPPCCSFHW